MGGYWKRIFRIFLLEIVLIVCDSFPYVKQGHSDVTLKQFGYDNGYRDTHRNEDDNVMHFLNLYKKMPNGYLKTQIKRIKDPNELSEIKKRTQLLRTVRRQSVNSIATILKNMILPSKRATPDSQTARMDFSNYGLFNNTQFAYSNIRIPDSSKLYLKSFSQDLKNSRAPLLDSETSNNKLADNRRRRSYLLGFGIQDLMRNVKPKPRSKSSYGAHSSACDLVDQSYCLNDGACIYVVPLNIKTCQCKIGFTGQRCQMWNQEYLLALLSQEIFG